MPVNIGASTKLPAFIIIIASEKALITIAAIVAVYIIQGTSSLPSSILTMNIAERSAAAMRAMYIIISTTVIREANGKRTLKALQ